MNLGLKGKKVLVTASTSGIGRAIAEAFLNEGADVALNGRDVDKLDRVFAELKKKYVNSRMIYIQGDATDFNKIDRAFETLCHEWGYLDVLIPCTGTGKSVANDGLSHEEWDYMMNYNLYGTIEIIRRFEPLLKKSKSPSVVMISSIAALGRIMAPPAYAAAKSAILTLNNYMAGRYNSTGIRINSVVPGNIFFEGGRWEELLKLDSKGVHEYIDNNVPMKRFGKPEEVADAIVFLASERATFINGAVLTVDGGQNRSF